MQLPRGKCQREQFSTLLTQLPSWSFPLVSIPEGAGEGATATLPAARSNSLSPDVNVEVHNYGAQEEATGRSKSGRGLQQMVSDSVAKDMKRGGAGAIAIKHAFGVARQPIQR